MATIPRSYMTTSKHGLSSVPLKNGQVISIWDSDEVWYDAPADGSRDGTPIRRKISGVRVVSTLPDNPMEGIAYIYLGSSEILPDGSPLYEIRIWAKSGNNYDWYVVGTNKDDSNVKTEISDNKFYIVGTSDISDNAVGSLLKNSNVYVLAGEIYGDLKGNADTATECNHAATADLATGAINDNYSTPQPITSYLRGVSSSSSTGTTLTFTKGDGTTFNVMVADTQYGIYTSSDPGLVNGTNVTVVSDNTDLILSGSGWIDINNITMPSADHATSADEDGLNQTIASTYIASLSFDNSTRELTPVLGDGNNGTAVTIPDTTYTQFTLSADGLVPASGSGSLFLRGDATWQQAITPNDIYQGATAGAAGVAGLVPAAASGETNKYLKSDGTWDGTIGSVFSQNTNGLVPGPASNDPSLSLKDDGTWTACPDTLNTVGATDDTINSLYVVGSPTQSSSAQSYTNQYVFINSGKLYQSNGAGTPSAVQVVDVSSTQALTNKTYEGYTLGTACAATVASSVAMDSTLPTGNAVTSYVNGRIGSVQTDIATKASNSIVAADYDDTSTSYAIGDYCMYDDGNGALLYKCTTAITAPAGAFDDTKWVSTTITGGILTGTLTAGSTSVTISDASIVAGSMLEVYTDVYGLQPTNVAVTTGQIVLTFTAQGTDVNIKIKVV